MMTTLRHGTYMMGREVRALWRQPWFVAITLVSPIIWLLLFGAAFKQVVNIPGFDETGSYIQFLVPGVVIMTAMFSSGWSGMGTINDLNEGVVDRFLVSPVRRSAMIVGRLMRAALEIAIQAAIVIGLGLLVGATFPGGVGGVLLLILIAALMGALFGAFSNGVALLTRQEETLIAFMQFLTLPLAFLASVFMPPDLLPGWIQTAADFNPVNWAVEAGREVVLGNTDWGLVAGRVGLLAALAIIAAVFATRAFRSYQRSV
jgi:ABC-2 type transport system permease protein